MKLNDHPTVQAYRANRDQGSASMKTVENHWLKELAVQAGADDAGIIDLGREAMADTRRELQEVMPGAASMMVMAFRLNQTPLRSTAHSVADLEFKQAMLQANKTGRKVADGLRSSGIRALNLPAGFPYEAKRWPRKMWLTSEKLLAVAAGLGQMGWNRLLLHPELGAAVVLGSVIFAAPCDAYDRPLDYNPCVHCALCVNVCPVGAVKRTDDFDFMACYSHNYRERLGGFQDWVEQLADSKDRFDYRRRVADRETVSMWQNLSIGAQTRCDRCMAVCPAGMDAIGEYLDDRKGFTQRQLKPFRDLSETVYVVKGSNAEQHVTNNFPQKKVRHISNGLRPASARHFLESLPLAFQSGRAGQLNAVYHFTFRGDAPVEGTVTIKSGKLEVRRGLDGRADLHVTADGRAWVRFIAKEMSLLRLLVTGKLRLKGPPKLLQAFAKCFPS